MAKSSDRFYLGRVYDSKKGEITSDPMMYDPDADVILMLFRMGYKVQELPVTMLPNPTGESMHRGIFRLMYYFFKMCLSFFVTLLREKR